MDDKSDSVHEEQGMDEEEEDDSSDDDEMPLPTFLLNKDLFDMNPIPEERSLAEMSPKVQKKMEHKTNKMFAKAKEKGVFRVFQFLLNNEFIHSFTFEPIPVKSNHLRNMIDKYCEKFSLRMETRKVKDWYIISVSKPLSMTLPLIVVIMNSSTSKKSEVRSSKPVKSTEPEQMTLMEGLSKPIGEDNIGNSLLKKMGWDGGALGQRGDGILEPIDIHIKRDNKGIGHDHKDNEEVHTSMSFVRSNK
ncbi:hypothetical protein JH06_3782 [Blastocystis sp. subtype 4]|uniref:hypothetical protein n=1 Tax=Blastocystis sp. subtype 4 TaxID=944170 RepID=UPI000711F649|nr:hypothetical protein JH06_3782 [Blastocystis sp. subtype 4]KNB42556.1 hypothetical protein JH06_3782 [Blastocystis sp. subtype 4]|eukprot:XP_014525999.1 hypothetical protein JH06_3782 [Blastocystis sp. subtype 4]